MRIILSESDRNHLEAMRYLMNLKEQIDSSIEAKEYRPTAVIILKNQETGEILLVQSAKSADSWAFPQGGIEPGENVWATVLREAGEELAIPEEDLYFSSFTGTLRVDAEAGRVDKRGFTKGKEYYGFIVDYKPSREIVADHNEIASYKWIEPTRESLDAETSKTRYEKRALLFKLLGFEVPQPNES